MGSDTLVNQTPGDIFDADDVNIIHRVLEEDFMGRNSSGAPEAGKRLGTPIIPWGGAYVTSLIIDGQPIDPALITSPRNIVNSGAVRSTSEFPDYLRAAGGIIASVTILGATTPLAYDVNGTAASIDTDIVKAGLTLALTSINTCVIDDALLTGQSETRFLGENGTEIPVSGMQSGLVARIGQFVALSNQTTGEIIYCRIKSSTRLDHVRRGFFFDDNGDPIPADVLNDGDVFHIYSLGFLFAEDDGVSVDVTYNNPAISGDEPTSPATGDYWYDLAVLIWKRYSGVLFVEIDRTFIGLVVSDTLGCQATRPEYFGKSYLTDNTLITELEDADNVISTKSDFLVSIDGKTQRYDFGFFGWSAAADFESGFIRTVERNYWLYITEDGTPKISGYKPYDLLGFLKGWYHPYESWRAVAQVYNNAGNDFELVSGSDATLGNVDETVNVSILSQIILSNNTVDPDHDMDSAAGKFTTDDGADQYAAPAFTKRLDVAWSKGSGNGGGSGPALMANTSYFYFALTNDDGSLVDFGMDIQFNAFVLLADSAVEAAGFTRASYQGSFRTDGSNNIRGFHQFERNFVLDTVILFASGAYSVTTLLDTNAPSGIVTRAKIAFWLGRGGGAGTVIWSLISTFQSGYAEFIENAAFTTEKTVDLYTDASSQVSFDKGASGFNIANSEFYLLGWEDINIKV